MSFVKFLQGIGGRIGILEAVAVAGAPATVRIQTRSVSLRDLTSEIQSGAIQSLAESPSELATPFEKIFEAAGISANPQEWTTERLRQVIAGEPFRNKPREEVQQAVLALLSSEGIAAEIIVKDAVARDQAMDAYETFAREKMQTRRETRKQRLLETESEIRVLQAECRKLEEVMKDDEDKWGEWKNNKRARERELASIVSYIVDHKVITAEKEDYSE